MPNWCYTVYRIVSDNQEELQDLYTKLINLQELSQHYHSSCCEAIRNQTPCPEPPPEIVGSGFNFFLGTVIKAFGGDYEKYYCRGCIIQIDELESGGFRLDTETAWGEMNEVWDLVMSHYRTLSYYYQAEEPGNAHFATNDLERLYFPEEYYIYDSIQNQTEYVTNLEELLEYMANALDVEKISSIEDLNILLTDFDENNPDECLYYYQFQRESN